MQTLRLGTRKSLLATAQSSAVARLVEEKNPEIKVELVGIETKGDVIQDVPLQKVEGKDFFVAEIDQALRERKVDFTVHSLKDLSLERPTDLVTAAVPHREDPRDWMIFANSADAKLRANQPLRIGTSSPRRLENLPHFLKNALPRFSNQEPQFEWVEIRGNVNTRISRLHDSNPERKLDGVCLAAAGLTRLHHDSKARIELESLLKTTRIVVMPLTESPTAPGQGALSIECRGEDLKTQKILRALHDEKTEASVARERKVLARFGGGCHQRFGATEIIHPELGGYLMIKGVVNDGHLIDEKRFDAPPKPQYAKPYLPRSVPRFEKIDGHAQPAWPDFSNRTVFIAHQNAVSVAGISSDLFEKSRLWVPGVSTWYALAKLGFWVEGCSEGFGFEWAKPLMKNPVLRSHRTDQDSPYLFLTHDSAQPLSDDTVLLPTYRMLQDAEPPPASLSSFSHFFWKSPQSYEAVKDLLPKNAHHSCGVGRTAQYLRSKQVQPTLFPSYEDWKAWVFYKRR